MARWTFGSILPAAGWRRLAPALVVAVVAGAGLAVRAETQLLAPGQAAPDFTADADGGGKVKLSDFRGKVVVLDFWATWCPPCQRSLPHLNEVARKAAGQDVVFLGVCVWDGRDKFNAWMDKNRSSYVVKFAFDAAGRTPDNIASRQYRVTGIPTTYIIGKDGKVADAIVGFNPGGTELEAALAKQGIRLK
jgi:thiol-disulfide isomerase/thioredoxin